MKTLMGAHMTIPVEPVLSPGGKTRSILLKVISLEGGSRLIKLIKAGICLSASRLLVRLLR